MQARYQYDAWGNTRSEVGSSWNRFGFTGHEHDKETGLIYVKARFYDPETGRFLGQDAWEGDVMLPPSLHKYLYAYQNPTVYVDPDGNKSVFGGATEQIGNFKDWLTEQNKAGDSQLAAAAIGTAQFVATLGEGITRPLDVAANLAQTAAGVDDQQVRDELAGTKQAIKGAADFVVNGDYGKAIKNAHTAAVAETVKALEGNVSATANLTQAGWGLALIAKPKAKALIKEGASGPKALLQAEKKSLKKIQSNVAKIQSLNEKINQRGIIHDIKQAARESVRQTDLEGVLAKNGKRGTRSHKILEEKVPKINQRYQGTGYGAQAERFRLPSPDGIKPGAPARKRQKHSRSLDVVITRNKVPFKGMDLKTGNAKFTADFKNDLRVRFKLDNIEEINIK